MSVPSFVKNKAQGTLISGAQIRQSHAPIDGQRYGEVGSNLNQIAKALNTYGERANIELMQQDIAIMRRS